MYLQLWDLKLDTDFQEIWAPYITFERGPEGLLKMLYISFWGKIIYTGKPITLQTSAQRIEIVLYCTTKIEIITESPTA